MKRTGWAILAAAAVAVLPGVRAAAQTATPWLHVRVEEPAKSSRVSVNLPMTVVDAALKAAPETVWSKGQIHLGSHKEISVAQLRELWKELKAAGDTDFVEAQDQEGHVTVGKRGDLVQIKVEKPGKQQVHVELPVAVVDAALSGEGEELNLKAAVAELQKRRGDIVRVNDENSNVRVWIDEKNTGQ